MAYANTLSSIAPADTDLLSLGDDSIRTLAGALIERLLTVFTDLDLQPLVFANNIISGTSLKTSSVIRSTVLATHSVVQAVLTGAWATVDIGDAQAAIGDIVVVNPTFSGLATALVVYQAHITVAGTIRLEIYNPTTATVNVNGDLLFAIIKATVIP